MGAPRVAARAAAVRSLLFAIPPRHALARDANFFDTPAQLFFLRARFPGKMPLERWMARGKGGAGIRLADSPGVIASLLGGLTALDAEDIILRDTYPSHV